MEFALPDKMSKFVKYSNKNINVVMDVLKYKEQAERIKAAGSVIETPGVDAETLLKQTNLSIKNMNHSLLKLIAVQ